MLIQKLEEISREFLLEATNSPRLLKDMAAMETYLAESYGDRILIELLQNADDAESSKALLSVSDDYALFANNGRPFNDEDLIAICRSGSSSKERGKDIGYRGVGFKSATSMSKHILISSSSVVFSFSKKFCAKTLGVEEDDVPTVRVPFSVNTGEIPINLRSSIDSLHQQGYSTVFAFLQVKQSIINEEVNQFDKSCLIFLRNIKELRFEHGTSDRFTVSRTKKEFGKIVEISTKRDVYRWLLIDCGACSGVAFKLDQDDRIVDCDSQEAVFHCYLPTLDPAPIRAKINSVFSTDPSRKHLSIDENTKERIEEISTSLQRLVQSCIDGTMPYLGMLRLYADRVSYSSTATLLYDSFLKKLLDNTQITLKNGNRIALVHYKLHEDFLSEQEKLFISNTNEHFSSESARNNNLYTQTFFEHFSKEKFSVSDYYKLLCDCSFAEQCDCFTYANLFAYVIKKAQTQEFLHGTKHDIAQCLVITENGIIPVSSLAPSDKLNSTFEVALTDRLAQGEWAWLVKQSNTAYELFKPTRVEIRKAENISRTQVSRWRSAEQCCVDIENDMGNQAKNVGNQNLGYDVESIKPDGTMRYLEVKLLSSSQGGFTMTNNEYSSAHQHGDSYYMCIINQKEDGINVTYIQNPLKNITLEKRVRQWEWYCEIFSGDECFYPYK